MENIKRDESWREILERNEAHSDNSGESVGHGITPREAADSEAEKRYEVRKLWESVEGYDEVLDSNEKREMFYASAEACHRLEEYLEEEGDYWIATNAGDGLVPRAVSYENGESARHESLKREDPARIHPFKLVSETEHDVDQFIGARGMKESDFVEFGRVVEYEDLDNIENIEKTGGIYLAPGLQEKNLRALTNIDEF